MLPFTREEFLDLFEAYNEAVWPAQPVAFGLGLAVLVLLLLGEDRHQRLIAALLGVMWAWTAAAYHWLFFTEINAAAIAFGFLFMIQAGLFLVFASRSKPAFRFRLAAGVPTVVGAALIGYALAIYPLIDLLTLNWPRTPAFGISPCPLTLFTLGLLLLADPRPPLRLWIVPLTWSLIGGSAAFLLGLPQDWLLLAAGPIALLAAYFPSRVESPSLGR
jgi:hypothetical protein